ncbi:unnamed protein product, partial [Cylicostephanus goldi]
SAEVNGKAVILTTGGFSADRNEEASLLHEFASDKVIGMDRVQVHPTAFVDPADPGAGTKFLAAEALRGKGAILINMDGVRFANELGRRDYLTGRILQDCKPIVKFNNGSAGLTSAIMLMNDEAVDGFGRASFSFYHIVKKFFTKYDTMEAFATAADIPYPKLKQTIEDYNKYVEKNKDGKKEKDSFGKTVFPVAFDLNKPVYAAIITPAIHYTMGGLKIDKQARVINEYTTAPFKGLLAAGEVTGGVHGANRLAGNSLLECVVFGRVAGRNAAATNY